MNNKPARRLRGPRLTLTVNGGSSSIQFALLEADNSLQRILEGRIERIGLPEAEERSKIPSHAGN